MWKRRVTWAVRVFLIVSWGVVGVVVTLFVLTTNPTPPLLGADLLCDLYGRIGPCSEAFDAHIKSRFAIGSADKALLSELQREGFSAATAGLTHTGIDNVYIYNQNEQIFCDREWSVGWQADKAGKILKIAGSYDRMCP